MSVSTGSAPAGSVMSEMRPASQALSEAVVHALLASGMRDVVLAPGSRSAPMAYALLAAERAGALRLHVLIDERSAGFVALGLAVASERPVGVVVTSGSAVANLHPAVLEAAHQRVPLVAISCDRPPSSWRAVVRRPPSTWASSGAMGVWPVAVWPVGSHARVRSQR